MKHILSHLSRTSLIGLLLMLSSVTLKAQTKEETIKWIVEKINKYGQNLTVYVPRNKDDATIICTSTSDGKTIEWKMNLTTPGINNDLGIHTNIQIDDIVNATIANDGEASGFSFIKCISSKKLQYPSNDGSVANENRGLKQNEFELYLNWDAEPDLLNRMLKAFTALISFNAPKEAF